MKNIFKTTLLVLSLTLSSVYAQNLQTTVSLGFSGDGTPFDGIFTAADVNIPTGIKGVSLNPSFSFQANKLFQGDYYYSYQPEGAFTTCILDNNPSQHVVMSGDLVLFANINPFKWLKSEKWNRLDMGIGAAYGVQVYSQHDYVEMRKPEDGSFLGYNVQVRGGVSDTYAFKAYYNYHINRYFIGLQIGVRGIEESTFSTMALQFGIQI